MAVLSSLTLALHLVLVVQLRQLGPLRHLSVSLKEIQISGILNLA